MGGTYSMKWGSGHPGCLIFLLDWSGSMSEDYQDGRVGRGSSKADTLATVLNGAITELKDRCVDGQLIKHRADVAVIGYGKSVKSIFADFPPPLQGKEIVSINDLVNNPLKVEKRVDKEMTQTGKIIEYEIDFPVWVQPVADGMTPMGEALEHAYKIAAEWIRDHGHCFPPVVINITDGAASDGSPVIPAEKLKTLETKDGNLLLFNCHLSVTAAQQVKYPGSTNELPQNDNLAPVLFEMSSELPEAMRLLAAEKVKSDIKPGDRAFVYNGDVESVINMIQMGTNPSMGPETPPAEQRDPGTV